MSEISNIYRDSCTVLLQAILTQACRVILSLAAAARHVSPGRFSSPTSRNDGTQSNNTTSISNSNTHAAALAHECVSAMDAPVIVENMNRHVLLTAVHLLSCVQRPHWACQHQNGELRDAVSAVLEDTTLTSTIRTALCELTLRKWSKEVASIHPLLRCALSVDAGVYSIVPTSAKHRSNPTALLQTFPELTNSHSRADVSCGCPHQWFRETLPLLLLHASMEQHARIWRHTNLLLTAFVRWQRQRGMRLLCRLNTPMDVHVHPQIQEEEYHKKQLQIQERQRLLLIQEKQQRQQQQQQQQQQQHVPRQEVGGQLSPPVLESSTKAPSSVRSEPLDLSVPNTSEVTYPRDEEHEHLINSKNITLKNHDHEKSSTSHDNSHSNNDTTNSKKKKRKTNTLGEDDKTGRSHSSNMQRQKPEQEQEQEHNSRKSSYSNLQSVKPVPLPPPLQHVDAHSTSPSHNFSFPTIEASPVEALSSHSAMSRIASQQHSKTLRRRSFFLWRDARLEERRRLRHMCDKRHVETKRLCWSHWWGLLRRHQQKALERKTEAQCDTLTLAQRTALKGSVLHVWWRMFLVRCFGRRTMVIRAWAQWHRAFIFATHAKGKAFPPIAARRLAQRCIWHWRDARRQRLADRMCLKRHFQSVQERLARRDTALEEARTAMAHHRWVMLRRFLFQWQRMAHWHRLESHVAGTSRQQCLERTFTHWCVCWRHRNGESRRVNDFMNEWTARRFALAFIHWRHRLRLRCLTRVAVAFRFEHLSAMALVRWQQHAVWHNELQQDRYALADMADARRVLISSLQRWRWRLSVEWRRRHLQRQLVRRRQQVLATAWFVWKSRAHLRRRGRPQPQQAFPHSHYPQQHPRQAQQQGQGNVERSLSGINRSFRQDHASVVERNRRDPLAALRAERVMLRGLQSTRWQSAANTRLFEARSKGPQPPKRKATIKRDEKEDTLVILLPSDVEEDASPSVDTSRFV